MFDLVTRMRNWTLSIVTLILCLDGRSFAHFVDFCCPVWNMVIKLCNSCQSDAVLESALSIDRLIVVFHFCRVIVDTS